MVRLVVSSDDSRFTRIVVQTIKAWKPYSAEESKVYIMLKQFSAAVLTKKHKVVAYEREPETG